MLLFELLFCWPWPYVLGHCCHVGRPIHDPFSVLSLREGGCRPKFPGTWRHSSSPRYGEVPRGEIMRGAPDRGRLAVTLCFFHFLIIAPTLITTLACLFSCGPSQPCAGLQFCP